MPHATIKVTNALDEVVYNGAVTGRIPTGSGSMTCEISQFGKKVTKVIQVSGNTTLDLGTDGVTITLDSEWLSNGTFTINNLAVTDASFLALKNTENYTLKCTGGTWDDGTPIEWILSTAFDSTKTISIPTYSSAEVVTTSKTVTIPTDGTYHIITCGAGGGGGGGGGAAGAFQTTRQRVESGFGGNGGNGGNANDIQSVLSEGANLTIQIGTGGTGGSKGESSVLNTVSNVTSTGGSIGNNGGTTSVSGAISISSTGGGYGSGGRAVSINYGYDSSYEGGGGDGGDGGSIQILGSTYKGDGGNGAEPTSTIAPDGPTDGVDPNAPSPFNGSGKGGYGGNRGNSSNYEYLLGGIGGYGGVGLVYNGTSYGKGGNGGRGAGIYRNSSKEYQSPTAGTKGTNGVVIIRRVAV